ncbi:MAG: hypothetical protein QOC92_3983 [Acidimicrobiaceae bacterium]|jgi:predicted nucleic acid-binding protein
MSTEDVTFVDSNVLVYAYDADAGAKHQAARTALIDLWNQESGVLSTQVLQEFYVTVTRKLSTPLARNTARDVVATYSTWRVHSLDVGDVIAASELEERHTLAFWDALILVAAQRLGASRLLSEDLQHGRQIAEMTIVNPFLDGRGG